MRFDSLAAKLGPVYIFLLLTLVQDSHLKVLAI